MYDHIIEGDPYGTFKDRLVIYEIAIQGIRDNPLFGVGYNMGVREYLAIDSMHRNIIHWKSSHPHNLFLELMLGCGMIGGLPLIVLMLMGLFHALKLIFFGSRQSLALVGLALILIAILIQGQFSSSVTGRVKPWATVYWLTSTLLIVPGNRREGITGLQDP